MHVLHRPIEVAPDCRHERLCYGSYTQLATTPWLLNNNPIFYPIRVIYSQRVAVTIFMVNIFNLLYFYRIKNYELPGLLPTPVSFFDFAAQWRGASYQE